MHVFVNGHGEAFLHGRGWPLVIHKCLVGLGCIVVGHLAAHLRVKLVEPGLSLLLAKLVKLEMFIEVSLDFLFGRAF